MLCYKCGEKIEAGVQYVIKEFPDGFQVLHFACAKKLNRKAA